MSTNIEGVADASADTTDDVSLEVPGSRILEGPPRSSFTNAIRDYAVDVLKEASNLEAAHRADSSKEVQFTSAHVERAVGWVRERGALPRPRRWWYFWARVGQALMTLLTGIAISAMLVPKAWAGWGYIFTGAVILAVVSTIAIEYVDAKDRKR